MDKPTYQPPSDAIRRALIRYTNPATQVFAEYIPQMVNSGILKPAFTPMEITKAFQYIGITMSRGTIYGHLRNPYNVVTQRVSDNPLVANSTIFQCENPEKTFYLRPQHTMYDMIKESAYFREYEFGHRKAIPHYEIFEDFVDAKDLHILQSIYDKANWKQRSLAWINYYYHFLDISDNTRTPIDDDIVTKPAKFKVAFFDAIMTEGNYSLQQIQLITGIHKETLSYILKNSKFIREQRRYIVEAPNIWEAKKQLNETGYVKQIGDNQFLVQLPSTLRFRNETDIKFKYVPKPIPKKPRYSPPIKRNYYAPNFQQAFLIKSLRKIYHHAYKQELPNLPTIKQLLDYIKQQ